MKPCSMYACLPAYAYRMTKSDTLLALTGCVISEFLYQEPRDLLVYTGHVNHHGIESEVRGGESMIILRGRVSVERQTVAPDRPFLLCVSCSCINWLHARHGKVLKACSSQFPALDFKGLHRDTAFDEVMRSRGLFLIV